MASRQRWLRCKAPVALRNGVARLALRRAQTRKSILDTVGERAGDLSGTLGASDKRKVDEYLFGIRESERRIQAVEQDQHPIDPGIDQPAGIPVHFAEHLKLMFDLQVLAWPSDLTGVMTLVIGREGSLHVSRNRRSRHASHPHASSQQPRLHREGHADQLLSRTIVHVLHRQAAHHARWRRYIA